MTTQDRQPPIVRLIITLGVLAALKGLEYIPLPLLDLSEVPLGIGENIAFRETERLLSVVALGVTPLVSGFITVEVVAWLVPRWRRARFESPALRARLDRAALILSLTYALFQGFGLGIFLEGLDWQSSGLIVAHEGWVFRLVTMATLAAGTGVVWLGARLIDQRGLGGGLSVLVAWAALQRAVFLFERLSDDQQPKQPALIQFFVVVVIVCVSVGLLLTARFRFGDRRPATKADDLRAPEERGASARQTQPGDVPIATDVPPSATLRALPAGLVPASWAPYLLVLAGVFELDIPEPLHHLVGLALLIALAVTLGLHFHNPQDVANVWKRAFPKAPELSARAVSQRLVVPLFVSSVALVLLDWVPAAATPAGYPIVAATFVAPTVAVLLDLYADWRARTRLGELAVAWYAHRVYAADTALELLKHHGIEALPRSIHHRTILQFFGPFVPIAICVPVRHRQRARRLLRRAFQAPNRTSARKHR